MSTNQHAETLFVELMTELFQLDETESLDFGIYRIIKRHNSVPSRSIESVFATQFGRV